MDRPSLLVTLARYDRQRLVSGPMAAGALAAAACLAVRLTGLDHAGISFCYFKALTGRACFTCGSTRAFGHLGRFDMRGAVTVQPLVTLGALFVMAWGFLDVLLFLFQKRSVVELKGPNVRFLVIALTALVIANWAYLLITGV